MTKHYKGHQSTGSETAVPEDMVETIDWFRWVDMWCVSSVGPLHCDGI